MITPNVRPEINPVEVDYKEQVEDWQKNSKIKAFENHSKALEQFIRLKVFYLNKGDEKRFSHVRRIKYSSRARND
jgi:hypothetical protein